MESIPQITCLRALKHGFIHNSAQFGLASNLRSSSAEIINDSLLIEIPYELRDVYGKFK